MPGTTFYGCTSLAKADLGAAKSIGTMAFQKSGVKTLIIRTSSVCSLYSVSVFNDSPIASGTGYIYVPDDLVDSYKGYTNWVTYANQIKPLSELEG